MNHDQILTALGLLVICASAFPFVALGIASLVGWQPHESTVTRICQAGIAIGLAGSLAILGAMLAWDTRHVVIGPAAWVVMPEYHFTIKLLFDRLSVPFVILTVVLCGTIGAFASRYLHREPGFNRFFVLYAMFLVGMVIAALAGTIETLFAGWELVGLSSALLVAFYQERPAPPRNGLRVWVVYRVSDAALLVASVVMHHLTGEGDFDRLLGAGPWPLGDASVTQGQALVVGMLLVIAAAGKSALVPFSGWLPRAMEGPTPSSAVFYGALSVHLGVFLLLRVSPLLDRSPWLASAVVVLGLTTALFAYVAGSVQTDIKSALSFASLSQVGLIVAEIGLGFRYVALVHLLGHACLRTLQFVRAPSLLQDYRGLEDAIGGRLPSNGTSWGRRVSGPIRTSIYRLALERGYLDALLNDLVAVPFVRAFRWCDGMERRWTDFLSSGSSRESDQFRLHTTKIEELL